MKISIHSSHLLAILAVVTFFVFNIPVLAQTSDAEIETSAAAALNTQTKVDADNELNVREDTSVSTTGDSNEDAEKLPIREGGRTVGPGTIPEQQQNSSSGDLDEGGYGDVSAVKPDYLDADSDDDGIADVSRGIEKSDIRRGMDIKRPAFTSDNEDEADISPVIGTLDWARTSGGAAGKATFRTQLTELGFSTEGIDTLLQKLNRLKVDFILSEETNDWGTHSVSVNQKDVQDWTEDDRTGHQLLMQEVAEDSPQHASLAIVEHLLRDNRIQSIISNETTLEIEYKAKIKLFGFIPIDEDVTATLVLPGVKDAEWNLRTSVDWPWYARFIGIKESADIIDETMQSVAKVAKFKAGKALADTVK